MLGCPFSQPFGVVVCPAGIFSIGSGSTLSLRSLALDSGRSKEGGAIYVGDESVVNVLDCAFTNNDASNGGEPAL